MWIGQFPVTVTPYNVNHNGQGAYVELSIVRCHGSELGAYRPVPGHEFWPMHNIGNTGTIFDDFAFQRGGRDAFHLNITAARNWFVD